MDAHKGGEKGAAGEVRRINVVYFLSRGGKTDHPHLFRVNHLSRAGVRLRDVKRWLSELRGKDMPDNYSWSYKRKYKAGYVWQDLKDDDLITPISDNEYVLKGCDVRGTPPPSVQAPTRTPSQGPSDGARVEPAEVVRAAAIAGVQAAHREPQVASDLYCNAIFHMLLDECTKFIGAAYTMSAGPHHCGSCI